jgi:hypothetical protein
VTPSSPVPWACAELVYEIAARWAQQQFLTALRLSRIGHAVQFAEQINRATHAPTCGPRSPEVLRP